MKRTSLLKRLIAWKTLTLELIASPELRRFGLTEETLPQCANAIIEVSSESYNEGLRAAAKKTAAKKEKTPRRSPKPAPKAAKKTAAAADRPKLVDAIQQLLKPGEDISASEIEARLREKNWLPESKDIHAYLTEVFSYSHRKDGPFVRVSPGRYKLRGDTPRRAPPPTKRVVIVKKPSKTDNHLNGASHATA